ncbi:hypothetical protein [Mycobacterium sp. D16R24]|uniref:hypothetical protein n=1 Tax=Mycobacterium sp. D16R24 TaxID=1855656 RepID=UPI002570DD76|nr:hypothetical protein [Mycobacterium sp. D16R24]
MVSRKNDKTAGDALVERITAEMLECGLRPDGREAEWLEQARNLASRITELEECISTDGLSVVLNSGRVVLHPAIAEVRQHRAALARVLAGIQMEEAATKDPAKQKAAQVKWRAHNEARKRAQGVG